MREVTIDSHVFVVGKLDPKRAFHVMRRLAPLVGSLKDFVPFMTGAAEFNTDDLEQVTQLAEPLAKAIAEMSDADTDYVIDTCLSAVRLRIEGGIETPIMVSGGHMMFDWITMPMMIRLVVQSVLENLAGFMPAGASAS